MPKFSWKFTEYYLFLKSTLYLERLGLVGTKTGFPSLTFRAELNPLSEPVSHCVAFDTLIRTLWAKMEKQNQWSSGSWWKYRVSQKCVPVPLKAESQRKRRKPRTCKHFFVWRDSPFYGQSFRVAILDSSHLYNYIVTFETRMCFRRAIDDHKFRPLAWNTIWWKKKWAQIIILTA